MSKIASLLNVGLKDLIVDEVKMNENTFIDLFSGCGGLSLGFEMAGYKSLLAIDCWRDALDTYAYNRPEARTLCGDIAALDPEK